MPARPRRAGRGALQVPCPRGRHPRRSHHPTTMKAGRDRAGKTLTSIGTAASLSEIVERICSQLASCCSLRPSLSPNSHSSSAARAPTISSLPTFMPRPTSWAARSARQPGRASCVRSEIRSTAAPATISARIASEIGTANEPGIGVCRHEACRVVDDRYSPASCLASGRMKELASARARSRSSRHCRRGPTEDRRGR